MYAVERGKFRSPELIEPAPAVTCIIHVITVYGKILKDYTVDLIYH